MKRAETKRAYIIEKANILREDIRDNKHLLKYHVDYDYGNYIEYIKASVKADEIVKDSTIKLERLMREYAEYFV